MADITNLLAQGFDPLPANIRANALMQGQQLQQNRMRNALLQQQMQQSQEDRAAQQRNALMMQERQQAQQQYLGSLDSSAGPAMPINPARAMALGLTTEQVKALQGPTQRPPMVAGPGSVLIDPETRQKILEVPFKPETPRLPPIAGLQAYRETLPEGDPRRREVNSVIANETRPPKSAAAPGAAPLKPLPAGVLKMQQESLDKIGIAGSINADLAGLTKQIDDGRLSFGPISNVINKGRNLAGLSTEQSRNLSTFKSTLERLRNESLRLNTGVQTDGDAQRAWNELFENITDTKLVQQRLKEIQAINERGAELQRLRVNSLRAEHGHDPLDVGSYVRQPSAVGGAKGAYSDPEKERRYQEWKRQQGQQ